MKKLVLSMISLVFLIGCTKDDLLPQIKEISPELQIANKIGIKLESPFVTTEVQMNVKFEVDGVATIKILDIMNKVVSKEEISVKSGDNILKVHTSALPPSAYRIGLYDLNDNLLGITDFNKLQ